MHVSQLSKDVPDLGCKDQHGDESDYEQEDAQSPLPPAGLFQHVLHLQGDG